MRPFWSNLGRPFHYKRSPIHSFNYTSQFLSQSLTKFCFSLSLYFGSSSEGRRNPKFSLSRSVSLCVRFMMLMKGKRMKKTKRRNTLLLSRVISLLKGKEKNTLFHVLQQGCSFSPFSRSLYHQLYGNPFGSKKRV
ncbi:uncharacterized protein LOC133864689 [Alnus glutinosa]|uniref:uncharacterized protein LOC133864689 n=1 Tax=Alnus glutinosa TaxID=3517 RepID=UPI002D795C99|nr:uncharacterized protein LOC133864689 [Alnus glutinosa]